MKLPLPKPEGAIFIPSIEHPTVGAATSRPRSTSPQELAGLGEFVSASGVIPFNGTRMFITWRADDIRPY